MVRFDSGQPVIHGDGGGRTAAPSPSGLLDEPGGLFPLVFVVRKIIGLYCPQWGRETILIPPEHGRRRSRETIDGSKCPSIASA